MKSTNIRSIALSLFMGALATHAQSQVKTTATRWDVFFSAGTAIPEGQFAATTGSVQAGYASTGKDIQGSVRYWFSQYAGAELLAAYRRNPDPAEEASSYYNAGRLLGGPSLRWPLEKGGKWFITARALAGIQQPFPRQAPVYILNGNRSPSYTQPPVFAYEGGAGVQFKLSRAFFLLGNIDYVAAASKDQGWYFSDVNGQYSTYEIPRASKNSIDITLGAGWEL